MTGPAITIDIAENRLAINPDIYGVSFADADMLASGKYTMNRCLSVLAFFHVLQKRRKLRNTVFLVVGRKQQRQ